MWAVVSVLHGCGTVLATPVLCLSAPCPEGEDEEEEEEDGEREATPGRIFSS